MQEQQEPRGGAADARDPWLRTYFTNRLAMLDRDRSTYWPVWKDLTQQFAPYRGKFLTGASDSKRGSRKDQRLINNTGLLAVRTMASGMQAGISSPSRFSSRC